MARRPSLARIPHLSKKGREYPVLPAVGIEAARRRSDTVPETIWAILTGMLKTWKYRLYPSKKQESLLDGQVDECRWLDNHVLEARQTAWDEHQDSRTSWGRRPP
jgi:hypothetical protein